MKKEMKNKIIIEKLENDHPAKAHGFNYSVSICTNGYYSGNGKYFRTEKEAKEYKESL